MKAGEVQGQALTNMLPENSTDDVTDDRLVDAVAVRNGLLGHLRIQTSDVPHVLFRDFSAAVFSAKRMAFFLHLIVGIVGCCSNEQVGRITTRRIVTAVQNVSTCWYWSMHTFVREAMRAYLAPLFVANDAITFFVARAGPEPARVWFTDVVVEQKTIGEWHKAGAIATRS